MQARHAIAVAVIAALGSTWAPRAAGDEPAKGEQVVKTTCALCHQMGTAGAPLIGAKAEWAPRIAQGKDKLYEHALKGFEGANGVMPPKGGNASLHDDDVKAAVDYLISKVQ